MIYRQIEKLQNRVNSLLSLCDGSRAGVEKEDTTPYPQNSRHERLGIMLLKAQDGVLEERYFRRMEKWLLCDEAAMRYYVDFQSLTGMLSIHFNRHRLSQNRLPANFQCNSH